MRISCLSTGRVRSKRGARGVTRYVGDRWSDTTLPVNVFLIEHPGGLWLFDAGQTAQATEPGYFPWWQPFFRLSRFELSADNEAGAQLVRRGIDPRSIDAVVVSHLHTDHAGGIDAFVRSRVLVTRVEWAAAQGVAGRVRGYLPQHWPERLRPELVDFGNVSLGPFAGSSELAPNLVAVPTPGHTRGHMALIVRREDGGGWLLGGDVAHDAAELEQVAPEIAEFCRREGIVFLAAHDDDARRLVESRPVTVLADEGSS